MAAHKSCINITFLQSISCRIGGFLWWNPSFTPVKSCAEMLNFTVKNFTSLIISLDSQFIAVKNIACISLVLILCSNFQRHFVHLDLTFLSFFHTFRDFGWQQRYASFYGRMVVLSVLSPLQCYSIRSFGLGL